MPPAGKDILMKITPAILVDLILLAVLIVTVLRYAKKGFVSGMIDLVGSLVSLASAWFVSAKLSPVVFGTLFKSNLTERIAEALQKQGLDGITTVLDGLSGLLPQRFLDDIALRAAGLLTPGAPDVAQRVVEELVEPLVVPLIAVVLFFATFVVCRVLVALLVTSLANLNKIPGIGGVNHLLGVAVGLVVGLIHVLLGLCLLWAVVVITNGTLPGLNDTALSGSILYRLFSDYNPFFS